MYQAPSADELSQSLRAAVRAELPASDPWLWPNNLYGVLKAIAQALRGLYLRLEWVLAQAFTLLAEAQFLDAHGAEVGLSRYAATFASGTATATTNINAVIVDGTLLTRSDGVQFKTIGDLIATAGSTTLTLRAVENGKAGNTESGAPLTLVTPNAGVGAIAVDAAGLIGGGEQENDASFRARILDRKRNPPLGGTPAEYAQWARALPGLTRTFVQRATPSPGCVTIYFMMDEVYTDGVPQMADAAALQAILEAKAPADASVIVTPPTKTVVDITIDGLDPDSAAVRAAIVSELGAMFIRRAEPGTAAADFVFSLSWITEAISIAAGERRHQLTDPAADVSCGEGEIAVLGTVTFV